MTQATSDSVKSDAMANNNVQDRGDVSAAYREGCQEEADLSFEEILVKLGTVGRFQYIQFVLGLTPYLQSCFMTLGFAFIGFTPEHMCNEVNETELLTKYNLYNDSTAQVFYGQCDITLSSNQTGRLTNLMSLNCPDGRHFPAGKDMTLVSEWDMVCEQTGRPEIAQLLLHLGTVLGGILLPPIADRFGRKPILVFSSISSMVVEFIIAFAPEMYSYCVLVFIDGFVSAGLGCTFLILGMEMLIAEHRQVFGIVVCLAWVFCTVVVGVLGYLFQNINWRYFQAVGALTGLPCLTIPFFLYESPRWLAIKGRPDEALRILKKATEQNGKDFTEVQIAFKNYMKSLFPSEEKEGCVMVGNNISTDYLDSLSVTRKPDEKKFTKLTLFSMLSHKDTLIRLTVIWYLWTACNLIYYGIYMSSSDLAGNRFLNFCLMGLVEIPSNLLALYMMSKTGRLNVMRIFLCLAAFSLMGSVLLSQYGDGTQTSDIFSVSLFIFGKFAVTSAFNVLYILTPEIFPTVLRSTGIGSCRSVPKIGSMLAPYSRPLYVIAKWAPGTIFSALCFIGLLLSVVLPETKDQNLPTKLKDIRNTMRDSTVDDEKMKDKSQPTRV